MSQTKILGISNSIGVFDQFGTPVQNTTQSAAKDVASNVDAYYKHWNNPEDGQSKLAFPVPFIGNFGLGKWIALFETVTAVFLGFLQRSPATITNLLTTLSEFAQTVIAGRNDSEEKENKAGESLMASVISLAGGAGLYNWVKETYKPKRTFSFFKNFTYNWFTCKLCNDGNWFWRKESTCSSCQG